MPHVWVPRRRHDRTARILKVYKGIRTKCLDSEVKVFGKPNEFGLIVTICVYRCTVILKKKV